MVDTLERGRELYRQRAWGGAVTELIAAGRDDPLDPDDLVRLARAAQLAGRDAECAEAWTRAMQDFLQRGETVRAAGCAIQFGFKLVSDGELAQANGWFARAQRLLDDDGRDCAERGYLLVRDAMRANSQGDWPTALDRFARAEAVGAAFADRDLVAIGRQGQGRALLRQGETARGTALLDEAMVSVTAGELSPIIAGVVYCSVISACHEVHDLRRAREWTAALTQWCDAQKDLVPYRGYCLVYRAELQQLDGAWPDALDAARQAHEQLSRPRRQPAAGAASYRVGELHRLRGEFAAAAAAYRQAGEAGYPPEPGLALLRLAQGKLDAALAAIRRAAEEVRDSARRPDVMAAVVDIALAAGNLPAARDAADDLASIAARLDAPWLRARSAHARGAVLLAEGDAGAALGALRRAVDAWRAMEAPYECARSRVLIALACRAQGDADGAALEFEGARATFERLGAAPDVERVKAVTRGGAGAGMTAREREVLVLVATGRTNKAIAATLGISEKTVARHIANLFTKLHLTSRAAATAYAYEHGLVQQPYTQ